MNYFLLALEGLLVVAVAIGFKLLIYKTKFKNLPYWVKQSIYALAFGGLAIFGTECGININQGVINVRDAGPIVCGLFFGVPAGIGAGLIGFLERFFTAYAIPSRMTTQIACSVATLLAGCLSSLLRATDKKRNRMQVVTASTVAIVIEVIHMLLVYVTNINDIETVVKIYRSVVGPMLLANLISVFLSALSIKFIDKYYTKGKVFTSAKKTSLSNAIQLSTMAIALLTFFVGFASITNIQNKVSDDNTRTVLDATSNSVNYQTLNLSNYILGDYAEELSYYNKFGDEEFTDPLDPMNFSKLFNKHFFKNNACYEAYLITKENVNGKEELRKIIRTSSNGHNLLNSYVTPGSWPIFNYLIDRIDEAKANSGSILPPYISYGKFDNSYSDNENEKVIYAILSHFDNTSYLSLNNYIVIGMTREQIYKCIYKNSKFILNNQTYKSGCTILYGDDINGDGYNDYISSTYEDNAGDPYLKELAKKASEIKMNTKNINKLSLFDFNNERYFYVCNSSIEGFYSLSMAREFEVELSSKISLYASSFSFILSVGLIFIVANRLIDYIVVRKMDMIDKSLEKITNGELDTKVNVYHFEEFIKLSNGINETVDKLKKYINDANTRIDKELDYAKQIQLSCQPTNFPNNEFIEIAASTNPCKTVGGDFYDFYMTHNNLNMVVADVSDKGIPASLFMMRSKTLLKDITEAGEKIENVLTKANNNLARDNPKSMFVTAWQCQVNLFNGDINFVNAGHNAPLICHENGEFFSYKGKINLPLACMEGIPYKKDNNQFHPGDILVLYTDGITEAINENKEQYGEARFLAALNRCKHLDCNSMIDYIKIDLKKFVNNADQFDDETILIFKFKKYKDFH